MITLRRTDAVTLVQLRKVIHNSCMPSPSTIIYMEKIIIFNIKSWLCPYTNTLKLHRHPHAFRFKLNEEVQVEMTYWNWAMASKKILLPKEGQPFVILEDLPDGTPSLQRPGNSRCPLTETMEGCTNEPRRIGLVEKILLRMKKGDKGSGRK